MGGEISKKSGEIGEQIAEKVLNLIGWKTLDKGFNVKCIKNTEHSNEDGKKRILHGIDFYFNYRCPLSDRVQENVIISVKNRMLYPTSERTKRAQTKEFLRDLSQAIECFVKSEKYNENKMEGLKKINNTGVLFWINSNENKNDEIIKDIADMQITTNDIKFPMYIVDNNVANFLCQSIEYAQKFFDDKTVMFLYPSTGYNNSNYDKKSCGEILPVQYINSHIIPFKVEERNMLIITSMDGFNKEELPRLIALAQDLTNSWGDRIILAYPDYDSSKHKDDVTWAKRKFQDNKFIERIEIASYVQDFRNLKEV